MFRKLSTIWHPEVYHHKRGNANYFEGWFYKLVDASRENVLAVIPGVFLGEKGQGSHAFIQILNGSNQGSFYQSFSLAQFYSASHSFEIGIGRNSFSQNHLELAIQGELKISGRLTFNKLKGWPVSWFSPGAMGWYAFIPFMECYHGILSMDHLIDGELRMNGQPLDFKNGRGYLEKDWGRSFPQAYIWMQCNHFDQAGVSLTLSIAKIPWLRGSFRGFIIGFLYQDRLFRFTTYNGAELKRVKVEQIGIEIEVVNRRHRLQLKAIRGQEGILQGPYKKKMLGRVAETLLAEITVDFYETDQGKEKLLYGGSGVRAGLEMNGALEQLVDSK